MVMTVDEIRALLEHRKRWSDILISSDEYYEVQTGKYIKEDVEAISTLLSEISRLTQELEKRDGEIEQLKVTGPESGAEG